MESDNQVVRPLGEVGDRRSAQLKKDLQLMKDYLALCVRKEDWHGVMDAAADMREIIARQSMLD